MQKTLIAPDALFPNRGLATQGSRRYAATRHNAGFMVLDALRSTCHGLRFLRGSRTPRYAQKPRSGGRACYLAKPQTLHE